MTLTRHPDITVGKRRTNRHHQSDFETQHYAWKTACMDPLRAAATRLALYYFATDTSDR